MKSPIGSAVQRQRTSRHGKPHTMPSRTVKTVNGKVTVTHDQVPVPAEGYTRKGVAIRSTTNKGAKNVNPDKPRQAVKK